jgi:Papain family cysteine protease
MRLLLSAVLMLLAVPASAQTISFGLQSAPVAKYNAIPNAYSPLVGSGLPTSYDLSANMPPPGQQANQSCVGWAVAYALKTYHERIERNWPIVDTNGQIRPDHVFSPAFIYNQINGGSDNGSNFGDAFRVLATQGAAPWSAMPYSGQPFNPVPASARAAAAPYKIDTFRTLDHQNISEIKTQLFSGFPVVIGARVFQQFHQLPPGAVWTYASGPSGNHAMVVVGYDDSKQAFKVMNSWGPLWSSGGYGWISYNLFSKVVNEAYIVVDLRGVDSNAPTSTDVWTPPSIAPAMSSITVEKGEIDLNYREPTLGYAVGIRIVGTISIPAGVRGTAQIVLPLRFQNNVAVGSLSPAFMLPSGQAAFGTPRFQLDGTGITNLRWYAFMPYCSLNVPKTGVCVSPSPYYVPPAQSDLRTAPILFIDNFGVVQGQAVDFFVKL